MTVRTASTSGGIGITWGAEHRDKDGVLISRQASMEPPAVPQCVTPRCLMRYVYDSITYAMIASYHARRVAYAEANRRKNILERYRTGEQGPQNLWQAIHANLKLSCPVCRRHDVDPLLFKG